MSTQNQRSFRRELNKYLQGIYMGIDTFVLLKSKTSEPSLLSQCELILTLFEKHKLEIIYHIEQLDGKAADDLNFTSKLSNYFYHRKLNKLATTAELSDAIQEGFSTGITMVETFFK